MRSSIIVALFAAVAANAALLPRQDTGEAPASPGYVHYLLPLYSQLRRAAYGVLALTTQGGRSFGSWLRHSARRGRPRPW